MGSEVAVVPNFTIEVLDALVLIANHGEEVRPIVDHLYPVDVLGP